VKRLLPLFGVLVLGLALAGPALAEDPVITSSGPVQIVIDGDVTLATDQHVQSLVVIQGDALVLGTATDVTVVGGDLTLRGSIERLTIIDGRAELEAGSRVNGDVIQLNGLVHRTGDAFVGGTVRSLSEDLAWAGLFLGTAMLLIWIGAALLMLVLGLALSAFAARQVRTVEAIISREPVKALLVGLAMIVAPALAIVLLALTIVGLPLALTLLLVIWPTLALVGWLVAAIWIGEWLLARLGRTAPTQRPYLATFVGLLVAAVLGIIPLVSAVISIFGLGAVTLAGWRTLVGAPADRLSLRPQAAPMAT
jgi:hypothetical protein